MVVDAIPERMPHCECIANALRMHCECIANALRMHCERIANALRMHRECPLRKDILSGRRGHPASEPTQTVWRPQFSRTFPPEAKLHRWWVAYWKWMNFAVFIENVESETIFKSICGYLSVRDANERRRYAMAAPFGAHTNCVPTGVGTPPFAKTGHIYDGNGTKTTF